MLTATTDDLMQESEISELACVSASEVGFSSTVARLSKESGCAIAREAWKGMEHLIHRRRARSGALCRAEKPSRDYSRPGSRCRGTRFSALLSTRNALARAVPRTADRRGRSSRRPWATRASHARRPTRSSPGSTRRRAASAWLAARKCGRATSFARSHGSSHFTARNAKNTRACWRCRPPNRRRKPPIGRRPNRSRRTHQRYSSLRTHRSLHSWSQGGANAASWIGCAWRRLLPSLPTLFAVIPGTLQARNGPGVLHRCAGVVQCSIVACSSIQYKVSSLNVYTHCQYHVPSYQAFGPLPYASVRLLQLPDSFRGKISG